MINNIRIKTFIRLDQQMIDLLLPKVTVGHHLEKHWMFWTIPVREVTGVLETWLKSQPEDSWARVSYADMFSQLMLDKNGDRIAIGISLSEITPEQIRTLIDSRKAMSFITCTIDERFIATKNPYIFTDPRKDGGISYMYVQNGIGLPQPLPPFESSPLFAPSAELEKKFKDSLEGHDFWYDYSDSLSVWKAGEARTKELKDGGVAMGLSRSDVDRLYREKYKELMGK